MSLDAKKQKVMAAIKELMADTSVSQTETCDALEEIRDEIMTMINTLDVDDDGLDEDDVYSYGGELEDDF